MRKALAAEAGSSSATTTGTPATCHRVGGNSARSEAPLTPLVVPAHVGAAPPARMPNLCSAMTSHSPSSSSASTSVPSPRSCRLRGAAVQGRRVPQGTCCGHFSHPAGIFGEVPILVLDRLMPGIDGDRDPGEDRGENRQAGCNDDDRPASHIRPVEHHPPMTLSAQQSNETHGKRINIRRAGFRPDGPGREKCQGDSQDTG